MYGIGWILLDCYLIIQLIFSIRAGRSTVTQIVYLILFSIIGTFMFIALSRGKRRRKPSKITKPNNISGDEGQFLA